MYTLSYGFTLGSPITHTSPRYISLTESFNAFAVTLHAKALLTLSSLASKLHFSLWWVKTPISIPPLPAANNPVSTVIAFWYSG